MPRYTIKKGYEKYDFPGEGIRRINENTIESNHELNNPHLSLVTVENNPVNPAQPAPIQPVAQTQTVNQTQTPNQENK